MSTQEDVHVLEKKIEKAIELLIKDDFSIASVIAELEYPSRGALKLLRKQYLREQATGQFQDRNKEDPSTH